MSSVKTPPSFEAHARAVISDVRQTFGEIIEQLPQPISRPADLNNLLKIDRKLGWKISKMLTEKDPFLGAQYVPGAAATRIFLEAAAAQNVSATTIDAARRAADNFQRLVAMHAGRRDSFDRMLAGCAEGSHVQADLTYRKAAVTANSFIWNVHVRTQVTTFIISLSPDGKRSDIAGIRGCVDFRGYRPNTSWVIARTGCFHDDQSQGRLIYPEPLVPVPDEAPGVPGIPLLTEFCSKPLPKIERTCGADGCLEDVLTDVPVGSTGAVTCFTGNVVYGAGPRYRDANNAQAKFLSRVRLPTEALLMDLFVPTTLYGSLQPELSVYSDLGDGNTGGDAVRPDRDLIDLGEQVHCLGSGLSMAYTAHVPRYPEMLAYVFDRFKQDPVEYTHYRALIEYPVTPTTVKMCFPLPAPPDEDGSPEQQPEKG